MNQKQVKEMSVKEITDLINKLIRERGEARRERDEARKQLKGAVDLAEKQRQKIARMK